jgi:hypothetical protein
MLAGTIAAIQALQNVGRTAFYENPTGSTSDGSTVYGYPAYAPLPSGLPAHSITCVVEGSTPAAIATAIYMNRGIGPYTNGTTSYTVTDPYTGNTMVMRFYVPTDVTIYAGIEVHSIQGITNTMLAAIQAAAVSYLNSLQIGAAVTISGFSAAIMDVNPSLSNLTFELTSLTLGTSASAAFTASVHNGGTGYSVNNVLTVVQQGASGGTFTVTSVNPSTGAVTGLSPVATSGGTGYSPATNLATTVSPSGGTNCTVDLTQVAPTGTSDVAMSYFYDVAEGTGASVAIASV